MAGYGFNHWVDQEDFPPADWQEEVANGDTRLGYADWVEQARSEAEAEREAQREADRDRHADQVMETRRDEARTQ